MNLRIASLKQIEQGKVNYVYISKEDYNKHKLGHNNGLIMIDKRYAYKCKDLDMESGTIGLSKIQKEYLGKSTTTSQCFISESSPLAPIGLLRLSVIMLNDTNEEISAKTFVTEFKSVYNGFPLNLNQSLYFFLNDLGFKVVVTELLTSTTADFGLITNETEIYVSSKCKALLFTELSMEKIFLKDDFDFESLGIGGLKNEFNILYRRAFIQRVYDPAVIEKLGIMHVKGVLLYGPPGTGKTLIARQIGTLLNAREPKVVNGPEILSKYVGQSEENIRNLFRDAEVEYEAKKDKSLLHIIIFDEIDAICKSRGSSTTGVGDQIVNQLLSKMDGVDQLDNILVIGITNRIDLIDDALLRPGRFEIHLEISLPDEKSRHEILRIHTKKMTRSEFLEDTVDLEEIAKLARNYTGAEIAAVVKSAVSYSLERKFKSLRTNSGLDNIDGEDVKIKMIDFMNALNEVKPAFGYSEEDFESYNRVFYELPSFINIISFGKDFLGKLVKTNLYKTSSLLLSGKTGAGKTTLAVKIAMKSSFPFVKIISPKNLVGMSEYEKVRYIKDKFSDAYKSSASALILDEIESLIDYVNLGPRFSNIILQALKIFIKNEGKNKLFVIGTTSCLDILQDTGIYDCFYTHMDVPYVGFEDYQELAIQNANFNAIQYSGLCSIKSLLALLEEPDLSS